VQRDRELLVIKRHYRGRDYAVLPGGSVERAGTEDLPALGLHPAHLCADLPRLLSL
jgi:hypothetical protein